MTLTNKSRIIWISVLLGWSIDLLFWQHSPGINFLIFVILALAAGFLIAAFEKIRPAGQSLIFVPMILYFAGMSVFRNEPFTRGLNVLATLVCMALLVSTFTGGRWLIYSLSDYVVKAFQLFIGIPSKAFSLIFIHPKAAEIPGGAESQLGQERKPGQFWPVLRGILIALPILILLAALLSSADPVFSNLVGNFLGLVNLDRLGEYLFRLAYILCFGFLLCGVFAYALTASSDENLLGLEKPWLEPFLGWTESAIVLGSIDLLFAVFVGVQFRYFFGGKANVVVDGYTYAEYARKGFFELVWVAVISLLVYLTLSTITKKSEKYRQTAFSWMSGGLVVLVIVILVSAFQRLRLYEDAYGYTRIRIITHVFMLWLGLLMLTLLVLEISRHQRAFALAGVIVCAGFVITLNFLNVDGFISRMNIQRSVNGASLDVPYLASLSSDALPEQASVFTRPGVPSGLKGQLGAALACRVDAEAGRQKDPDWRAFNGSDWQGKLVMDSLLEKLKDYSVRLTPDGQRFVEVEGKPVYCDSDPAMID